jgi:hypothetical protein
LRTPLAVIIAQCDLVDEGIGDLTVATARIRRQAEKMLVTLNALGDSLHD